MKNEFTHYTIYIDLVAHQEWGQQPWWSESLQDYCPLVGNYINGNNSREKENVEMECGIVVDGTRVIDLVTAFGFPIYPLWTPK